MFGSGAVKFNEYGLGTFTGTLAKSLGVDASGNVIEYDASGGGGGSGISQVIGVNGINNVNDSTVEADTALLSTKYFSQHIIDSLAAITVDSNSIHIGYITIAGDTAIVFSDLKGNSDTVAISLLQYWQKNGAKVYYNGGNVGIGDSDPNSKLVLRSDMVATSNLADSNSVILSNKDSSSVVVKPSPSLVFSSYGHGTTYNDARIRMGGYSNTGGIFGPTFKIESSSNGGSTYSTILTLNYNGTLTIPATFTSGSFSTGYGTMSSSLTVNGITNNSHLSVLGHQVIGSATYNDYSASLQMRSTTQGFLPPSVTTVQRDSINLVITSVDVINGGSYSGTPTLSASSGANKAATLIAVKTGSAITSVTITDGGSYNNTPNISVSGGSGSGAILKANMTQTLTPGLQIFCSDCTATDSSTGVMQIWNGSTWKNLW